jgi:hypothetical protein
MVVPSMLILFASARFGAFLRMRRPLKEEEYDDFDVVEAATLTLLGLVIGFTFAMSITRYDLRKNDEESEANAIGTEYFRVGLMPDGAAAAARTQLRKYLDLRIAFYQARSDGELQKINSDTTQLQSEMWSTVEAPATSSPTPVIALAVSGMNDVLNSQGYTAAAWRNRIPVAAWGLLTLTAVFGNLLVGYGIRASTRGALLWVLPIVISISFLLIDDIDTPRGGLIHIYPQNLQSLLSSLPK